MGVMLQSINGKLEVRKEPYATTEFETESDYLRCQELLKLGLEYEAIKKGRVTK